LAIPFADIEGFPAAAQAVAGVLVLTLFVPGIGAFAFLTKPIGSNRRR
jgi:hypothetical protein